MASDNLTSSQPTSAAVSLFQKAHGRMTTIQRIDEQVAALQEQRRKLQDELRAVQALINEEFERVMSGSSMESPNRMLAHMADSQRSEQESEEVVAEEAVAESFSEVFTLSVPDVSHPSVPPAIKKRGVLIWIAIYKIIKATLTLAAGVATLQLRHRDLTEIAVHLVHRLNIAPDSRTAVWILGRVLHIDNRQLAMVGAGFFLYSALYFIEGIGLYREKLWGEWLTAVSSCLLLPLEVYELFHHPNWIKVGFLLANLAVIAYLAWRIDREVRARHAAAVIAASKM